MKIALAQFEVIRGEPVANIEKIKELIVKAKAEQAKAIFLPEMCTTGFDWKQNLALLNHSGNHCHSIAQLAGKYDIAICGSFLEATESGRPANTLHYFERSGSIAASYRKAHLFTLFGEDKHMEPGNSIVTADTEMGRVGCSICYDLRFPELFRKCALEGALLQILPAAFPHPRQTHWKTLIRARAIENQVYVIATNQCGYEKQDTSAESVRYFGCSMVVDPWGEILLETDEFEGVHIVDIDIDKIDKTRDYLTVFKDRRPELY